MPHNLQIPHWPPLIYWGWRDEFNLAHIHTVIAGRPHRLAACGYSTTDRALSGAGIGAGVGAAGSMATGGNPVTGGLLGGAAGAAAGGLTSPDTVNLGKPVWK